ncbi:O-antigen ligase [Parvularcula sp. IMCC14364]|uniref:O-antigen ligase family protein n=1 Tax=Parvularcula sp. IMCC14364 TaxID=3067902 RepID=UPI0027415CEB|nr:O-antigen ligase family protein [Parvularcula sp. IMCC14364]
MLGGTSQDIVQPKLWLQVIGTLLISFVFLKASISEVFQKSPYISILIICTIFLHLLYLLPLPPFIWSNLPGRDIIETGFNAANLSLPWQPLSLAPDRTLSGFLSLIPALAVYLVTICLASKIEIEIAINAFLIFAVITVGLGLFQVSGAEPLLYFYDETNPGAPVAFFSNVNHQATLLLMAIPFAISMLNMKDWRAGEPKRSFVLSVAVTLILTIGLMLNGSMAGYLLLLPALGLSFWLLIVRGKINLVWMGVVAAPFIMFLAIDAFLLNPIGADIRNTILDQSSVSRSQIFAGTMDAIYYFFPIGTGPGTFSLVYPLFENIDHVTSTYAPQAHNEYLQVVLEFGLLGGILMMAFIWWWFKSFGAYANSHHNRLARCAIIATLLVMVHSTVDYPLRTIAISTMFSFCVALIVRSQFENQ